MASISRLVTLLRFRHLRLVVELSRSGSLRAAAQALSFTQPALSKALGEIERGFGFALFTRTARGVTPTRQGALVVRGAAALLEQLAHLHAEASAGDGDLLRIGAPPFVAQAYLPAVLARLARGDPALRVELTEERVPHLIEALRAGRLDALVSTYPPPTGSGIEPGLRYRSLFDAEFSLIAPAGHPLSGARRVSWERIAGEPWVLPAPTTMSRHMLEAAFVRAGVAPPRARIESTSPVTTLQLVAAGLGLGLVPSALLRRIPAPAPVRALRVSPSIAAMPVALIERHGPANPRLATLRAALSDAAGEVRPVSEMKVPLQRAGTGKFAMKTGAESSRI